MQAIGRRLNWVLVAGVLAIWLVVGLSPSGNVQLHWGEAIIEMSWTRLLAMLGFVAIFVVATVAMIVTVFRSRTSWRR
jgi:hypothetical protein